MTRKHKVLLAAAVLATAMSAHAAERKVCEGDFPNAEWEFLGTYDRDKIAEGLERVFNPLHREGRAVFECRFWNKRMHEFAKRTGAGGSILVFQVNAGEFVAEEIRIAAEMDVWLVRELFVVLYVLNDRWLEPE